MARWLPVVAVLLGTAPALEWTARTLRHEAHRPNLLVLALAVALALRHRRPLGPLRASWRPLSAVLLGLLGFAVVERTLDLSLLSATFALVALYGLFGLYVSPGRWRRARGGALLTLAALPFADQADHYLGFGLRVLTAKVVAHQLGALGLSPVAAESILVLERGVADVEAACSGLGSLWAGGLLLLGLAFAQRRPIGLAFGAALVAQSLLLFGSNVLRITALVALAHHLDLQAVAEVVHQPLGVLGFALSGLVGAFVLTRWPTRPRRPHRGAPRGPRVPFGAEIAVGLTVVTAAAVGLTHQRRPAEADAGPDLALTIAGPLRARPIPLDPQEHDLFFRWGAPAATKVALELPTPSGPLRAAAVFVPATHWRAHHPPALCLTGAGHHLDAPRPTEIGAVRGVHTTTNRGAHTAVYWFQTQGHTTDALLERIQDGLVRRRTWVIVTVVVEGARPADDPHLTRLVDALFGAVDRALAARSPS